MKKLARVAILSLALVGAPMLAQDDGGDAEMIVVTAQRAESRAPAKMTSLPYLERRPLVGLRRAADGVVRPIEIVSDSLDADVRRKEVEAMLLAAIDRAGRQGLSLVTGTLEIKEVTRENWRTVFPGLVAGNASADDEDDDDDEYDDDEDENGKVKPGFEDDGSTATIRLLVRTKLTGTISDAQKGITAFVKAVPASGRSLIKQKGTLSLTIINPEQYRDDIYRRIAKASQHAASFYGEGYKVEVTGLDREIAWAQVSNTEVFLYIPYSFVISK
jgi:hypothetical protein